MGKMQLCNEINEHYSCIRQQCRVKNTAQSREAITLHKFTLEYNLL